MKKKNPPIPKNILRIPILLCKEHLEKNPKEFLVKTSSKWKYVAIPISKASCSCYMCTNSLNEPSIFFRDANLSNKNLRYANFRYANLACSSFQGAKTKKAIMTSAHILNTHGLKLN